MKRSTGQRRWQKPMNLILVFRNDALRHLVRHLLPRHLCARNQRGGPRAGSRGRTFRATGGVMEQIWDQITKSKLLLADLSGKNANVFYELGLAHAARKPVVFTASAVDDVPFDLRHLRVIIYDVRVPEWASKMRASITDYLRNATKDPDKSIPHPFRSMVEEQEAPASWQLTRLLVTRSSEREACARSDTALWVEANPAEFV
jgi:hypothetical protein